jgi:hypothetical protein
MELTEEQIKFLDEVCEYGKWTLNEDGEVDVDGWVNISHRGFTEIPVKFGRVGFHFFCHSNQLTTLKNCPTSVGGTFNCGHNNLTSLDFYPTMLNVYNKYKKWLFYCDDNNLTEYFKNIKKEDFTLWENLYWNDTLMEYPFLINIGKMYLNGDGLRYCLDNFPQTKLYLE